MEKKEFTEPQKLEIYIPKIDYQLAEHIGNLCGYERYGEKIGKDKGHFHDVAHKVILTITKAEWE